MKFGLLFQLQTPRPADADTWHQDDERNIIQQALEQIELRLNATPEPWRDFAHRSAELAARLTS